MAKFSFHGDITGDNHQFGDKNTQINNWLEKNEAIKLDLEEIGLIKKVVRSTNDLKVIKKIFHTLDKLDTHFSSKKGSPNYSPPHEEIDKINHEIRNLIKEDKLEDAVILFESQLSKLQDKEGLNSLAILQSNIKNLGTQYSRGTQGYEEMMIFRNRAYSRLLSMISKLE